MKGFFKFLLVISVIFLASCSSSNGDNQSITGDDERLLFSDSLLAVSLDGKWGYIDEDGDLAIDFEYDNASAFILGTAIVVKGSKYGLINTKNQLQTDWYDYLYKDDANGLIWFVEDDLVGLMDEKGKIMLEAQFDDLHISSANRYSLYTSFSNGYAKVGYDGDYGFIDEKGKFLIPLGEAIQMNDFRYGMSNYYDRDSEKQGYKNTDNEIVIEAVYDSAGHFNKFNQAIVQIRKEESAFQNNYFVIDNKGNIVIDQSEDIRFLGDAYRVRDEEGTYFVDEKGKPFNDNVYQSISNLSWWSSYPFYIGDGKIINQFGEVVHENEDDVYDYFVNGNNIVLIEKDGNTFTIIDGNKIIELEADDIYDYTSDFIAVEREGGVGVINHKDKVILPYEYYGIAISDDGFFILFDEDYKIGFADNKGNIIVEPTYDSVELDINPY